MHIDLKSEKRCNLGEVANNYNTCLKGPLPDHTVTNSRDFSQEFWSGQVVGNLILKIFFYAFLAELGHLKQKTLRIFSEFLTGIS